MRLAFRRDNIMRAARLAPAAGGNGSSAIGSGHARAESVVDQHHDRAARGERRELSDRMSTLTAASGSFRIRISPSIRWPAMVVEGVGSRTSAERSMLPLWNSGRVLFPAVVGRIFKSSAVAQFEAHGHHQAIAGRRGCTRSMCRYTAGRSAACSKRRAKRRANGASGQAIIAPIRRRSSCSSANQAARRSHHGSEENVAVKPEARKHGSAFHSQSRSSTPEIGNRENASRLSL